MLSVCRWRACTPLPTPLYTDVARVSSGLVGPGCSWEGLVAVSNSPKGSVSSLFVHQAGDAQGRALPARGRLACHAGSGQNRGEHGGHQCSHTELCAGSGAGSSTPAGARRTGCQRPPRLPECYGARPANVLPHGQVACRTQYAFGRRLHVYASGADVSATSMHTAASSPSATSLTWLKSNRDMSSSWFLGCS